MPYFDHASCPSCGAHFDPEQIVPRGDGFACPACGSQLGLRSLFGLADAFVEEEPEAVTFDDLVPGSAPARPAPTQRSAPRQPPPAAPRGSTQLVRHEDTPASTDPLDLLRDIRKNR